MIGGDAKVTDNTVAFVDAINAAQVAGLIASGMAYQRDMKRALRSGGKGYVFRTSVGNIGHIVKGKRRPWTTGTLWNSVTLGTVERIPGGLGLRVGTNVKYALYWELGHHNIFTKHFERDEKWLPIYRKNAARYAKVFTDAFNRVLGSKGMPINTGGGVGSEGSAE